MVRISKLKTPMQKKRPEECRVLPGKLKAKKQKNKNKQTKNEIISCLGYHFNQTNQRLNFEEAIAALIQITLIYSLL